MWIRIQTITPQSAQAQKQGKTSADRFLLWRCFHGSGSGYLDPGTGLFCQTRMVKEFVRESLPPFLLLHGTEDQRVYIERSDYLYEQLQAKNVSVEYYILDGASHASAHFSQPEVKQIILSFCDGILKNDW